MNIKPASRATHHQIITESSTEPHHAYLCLFSVLWPVFSLLSAPSFFLYSISTAHSACLLTSCYTKTSFAFPWLLDWALDSHAVWPHLLLKSPSHSAAFEPRPWQVHPITFPFHTLIVIFTLNKAHLTPKTRPLFHHFCGYNSLWVCSVICACHDLAVLPTVNLTLRTMHIPW